MILIIFISSLVEILKYGNSEKNNNEKNVHFESTNALLC